MDISTPVKQLAKVEDWKDHFFGISPSRWQGFAGKVFLVTGAGTGFGQSIAMGLALAGAEVILASRRQDVIDQSINTIKDRVTVTGNLQGACLDVTDEASINNIYTYIQDNFGRLDGIVHSAALSGGFGTASPIKDYSSQQWDAVMNTNVKGPWLLTQTLFPLMLKADIARVLFITSEAGWAATPGVGVYNISKAALNSLGHSMAQEYKKNYPQQEIQINTLIPGEAKTEMNRCGLDSPDTIISMVLTLLSCDEGGPNGRFFHRDGRHFRFAHTLHYPHLLNE